MLQCFDLVSIFSSSGGPFLPIDCVGLLGWDFAYQNMQDIRIILQLNQASLFEQLCDITSPRAHAT